MNKNKQMYALIIAIFLSVLLIAGWVFTDRSVKDLVNATPIFFMNNTASAPSPASISEDPVPVFQASDPGMCLSVNCR